MECSNSLGVVGRKEDQQRRNMAQNSRYSWLANIEDAIVQGDFAGADALLAEDIHAHIDTSADNETGVVMADGAEADYIVSNYINLYKAYLRFNDTLMNADDSAIVVFIANLCPETDGNVVYQARAFYSILFDDDTTLFSDACGNENVTYDTSGRRWNSNNAETSHQSYKIFPNPNQGRVTITAFVDDIIPVSIRITDLLGRQVYSRTIAFAGGKATLDVSDLQSGIYVVNITDSNGKIHHSKIAVEK